MKGPLPSGPFIRIDVAVIGCPLLPDC